MTRFDGRCQIDCRLKMHIFVRNGCIFGRKCAKKQSKNSFLAPKTKTKFGQSLICMSYFCCQGYIPTALERRRPVMDRKRQEYCKLVQQYYDTRLQELHQETFRQVVVYHLLECTLYMWCVLEMWLYIIISDTETISVLETEQSAFLLLLCWIADNS